MTQRRLVFLTLMCSCVLVSSAGRTDILWTFKGFESYYATGDLEAKLVIAYEPHDAALGRLWCFFHRSNPFDTRNIIFSYTLSSNETFYGERLDGRSVFSLSSGLFRLIILNPTAEDEGYYECFAVPAGNNAQRQTYIRLSKTIRLDYVIGDHSIFVKGNNNGIIAWSLIPADAHISHVTCYRNSSTGTLDFIYDYDHLDGIGNAVGHLSGRSFHTFDQIFGKFVLTIYQPMETDAGLYMCDFSYFGMSGRTLVAHSSLKICEGDRESRYYQVNTTVTKDAFRSWRRCLIFPFQCLRSYIMFINYTTSQGKWSCHDFVIMDKDRSQDEIIQPVKGLQWQTLAPFDKAALSSDTCMNRTL